MRIYYLNQNLPKKLRELKRTAESYEKSVPKPSESYGKRWIEHKLTATQSIFVNYSGYVTHMESLIQTDNQPQKRAEISGFSILWTAASTHIYIYLHHKNA